VIAIFSLLLLLTPETERLLLGPSPFFRHEGAQRALRDGDIALLHKAARSNFWDARRLAATALGKKAPVAMLEDPVAVVREAALRALGTDAPADAVVRLLKDSDDAVRAAAAWALVGRAASRDLRPLLRDPSPTVRIAALAAMGRVSELRVLSTKPSLGVAVAALHALGEVGNSSTAVSLLTRLNGIVKAAAKYKTLIYLREQPSVDIAVARAVGDLARRGVRPGGKSVGEVLRKIIDRSELRGSVAIILAEAVAGARDPEAARRLLDAQIRARRSSTVPNRYWDPALQGMLHALAREPWPQLAPLLFPLLEDRDRAVRLAVVEVLHGASALLGLRDPDPVVRAAACARITRLKSLRGAAADESPVVRVAAARALGRLGDPAASPTIAALLKALDPSVRRAAVGACLRIAFPERIDLLYEVATRDVRKPVRAAAGAVLSFLEAEAVLARAIADLEHDALHVRGNALELIHALTSARIDYDPNKPAPGAATWRAWIARSKEREQAPDAFTYHVADLRKRGIDLVLVLDATGSMAPVIQATKRRLQAVVARLRAIVPDLRVRVVAYRDAHDAFLTLSSPLTHDPRILEDFLACIPAAGGGDAPEAVLAGLEQAVEQTPWRNKSRRVVLLFGDAPPHQRDMALLRTRLREFKTGVVHTVDAGTLGFAGIGGVSAAGKAFRQIAEWGRGSFVRLADEDDLLRSILVLTLGPAHRTAVETLFGL